jgi:LPS export ABC transporter protein LptC
MRGAALLALVFLGCSEPSTEGAAERVELADAPDQEAWDVTKDVTRNGVLRASIRSPHLRKYDRERVSRLDGGVSVTFYASGTGKVLSTLTSQKALIDEGRRILTAMDSVVLVSSRGSSLYTDTLRWEEETELIRGPSRVVIEGDDGTESGIGFEATSDLSSWMLREVVTRIDSTR